MVPGMQHCGGGPGPNSFGQGGVPVGDAQHDINAALERWVEQGIAPESIIAAKVQNREQSGERRGAHASVVRLSRGGALEGVGQYR